MMFSDLREFLKKAEAFGEYQLVEGADWNVEIGALTELAADTPASPLLLFDKIKDYPAGYRVAANLFTSDRRIALGLGLAPEFKGLDLVRALRDRIKTGIPLVPPVEVETRPIKENVQVGDWVDIFKFPSPKWHELDGGRYIGTGAMTITRDPDEGWVNLATQRVQIHDRSTATIYMGPAHHGAIMRQKYWDRGLPCPAAVSCGQDPALWAASCWRVPWGVSEYDFAGGLRGKPIEITRGVTTDLPIPATAEIVLEGEIVPPAVETRMEGPFGEWGGYYASGAKLEAAFRIKSVLHRNNPIIQGNPPSRLPSVWTLGYHIQRAASVWAELDRQISGVRGVWQIEDSADCVLIISLKQHFAGHAKQAALIAATCSAAPNLQLIIVVDDDIDPTNMSEVFWALGTRVDAEKSFHVISGLRAALTNPTVTPENKRLGEIVLSTGIILACKPYGWIEQFPRSCRGSPELLGKTRAKWSTLLAGMSSKKR